MVISMWHSLILIETPVVEPQNYFTVYRTPTVPDDSELQVPVNHEFSETFERETLDGKTVGKRWVL